MVYYSISKYIIDPPPPLTLSLPPYEGSLLWAEFHTGIRGGCAYQGGEGFITYRVRFDHALCSSFHTQLYGTSGAQTMIPPARIHYARTQLGGLSSQLAIKKTSWVPDSPLRTFDFGRSLCQIGYTESPKNNKRSTPR